MATHIGGFLTIAVCLQPNAFPHVPETGFAGSGVKSGHLEKTCEAGLSVNAYTALAVICLENFA
jgi:hypothetical protein